MMRYPSGPTSDIATQRRDVWTNYCMKKLNGIIPERDAERLAKLPMECKLERLNDILIKNDWLRLVIDTALGSGWGVHRSRYAYVPGSPRSTGAGFPDLVLVRERIIFVELKTERGHLTERQRNWRDALQRGGAAWYMWRPSDWEQVLDVLGCDVHSAQFSLLSTHASVRATAVAPVSTTLSQLSLLPT